MHPSSILLLEILLITTGLSDASVGLSYYLPGKDLYSTFEGGYPLFANNLQAALCIGQVEQSITKTAAHYFDSTDSFFSSVSSTTGISAGLKGLFTMGATLNVKSSSLYETRKEVKGFALDYFTITASSILCQTCLQTEPLSPQLVEELESLPPTIMNPRETSSWDEYKIFLQKYGSHVVSSVHYGSRMRQWVFSDATSRLSQRDFALRACIEFGVFKGNLDVENCNGFTNEEIQRSERIALYKNIELRGGSDDTRNQLQAGRTKELLTKFLDEGRNLKSAIDYRWVPIWEILTAQNKKYRARALNMQQYYEGMLDFGCTLIIDGDFYLRWFDTAEKSTEDVPQYECWLRKNVCQDVNDCEIGEIGSGCYCRGPSCVEWTDPPAGQKAESAKIRRSQLCNYNYGINKSCYYHAFLPPYCRCHDDFSVDKRIWPTSDKRKHKRSSMNPLAELGNDCQQLHYQKYLTSQLRMRKIGISNSVRIALRWGSLVNSELGEITLSFADSKS